VEGKLELRTQVLNEQAMRELDREELVRRKRWTEEFESLDDSVEKEAERTAEQTRKDEWMAAEQRNQEGRRLQNRFPPLESPQVPGSGGSLRRLRSRLRGTLGSVLARARRQEPP
jgi:hypothetical protein